MVNLLSLHMDEIHRCLERIKPAIDVSGSEEQRQLVAAMHESVRRSKQHNSAMPRHADDMGLWRHNAIGPVSLCINSADLLLTDDQYPLNSALQADVQHIYETALKMNALIQQITVQYEQQL